MSLNAPLKILRSVRVPFLLFRAQVTNITVVGIILYHSTLILTNSRRKALKSLGTLRANFLQDVFFTLLFLRVVDKVLPSFTLRKTEHRRRTKTTRFETVHIKLNMSKVDWNDTKATVTKQIVSFYLKLCKNKKKWQDCNISTKNKKAIPSPMLNYHSLIPWGAFRDPQEEKWGSFRGRDHFGGFTVLAIIIMVYTGMFRLRGCIKGYQFHKVR